MIYDGAMVPIKTTTEAKERAADPERGERRPINSWGAIGLLSATFGLLSAVLIGSRSLTIGIAGVGIACTASGMLLEFYRHKNRAWGWLTFGALMCLATLGVTVFAGGLLNSYWGMDAAVPVSDPHLMVVVPRDAPRGVSRPLLQDDCADGVKEAIRQDDVVIRLNAVRLGSVLGKPETNFLLVEIRLSSGGNERILPFEGFDKNYHRPVLKDGAGALTRF